LVEKGLWRGYVKDPHLQKPWANLQKVEENKTLTTIMGLLAMNIVCADPDVGSPLDINVKFGPWRKTKQEHLF